VTITGKENELRKNAGYLMKAGDVGYIKNFEEFMSDT